MSDFNSWLKKYLPKDNSILSKAMRYPVMAGGKRFRPLLCLEAAKLFSSETNAVLPAACAIEMIHTFTLIHDDLPAMDNSDLRRGKPTCHKVFGEDIAILAGDALNTLAFEIIAKHCKPTKAAQVIAELASALLKVVQGQVLDLKAENKKISFRKLQEIHLKKTSALIEASVRIGAILANAFDRDIKLLTNYARHLGLAFQITDDILDATSVAGILGKPAQADKKNKKSTYVTILGLERARKLAQSHRRSAEKALKPFGRRANTLIQFAEYVTGRKS